MCGHAAVLGQILDRVDDRLLAAVFQELVSVLLQVGVLVV
jgi:hypothetical protein